MGQVESRENRLDEAGAGRGALSALTARRYHPVLLLLFAGTALAVVFFAIVRKWERERVQSEIERRARTQMAAVQRAVDRKLEVVRSIAGLFSVSYSVDRREFQAFVKGALAAHSDIQTLAWVPRVRDLERTNYEERAHLDGLLDFRFTQRDDRGQMVGAWWHEEYFPVYFVEPLKGNEGSLGLDLATDPTYRAAMDASRRSGAVVSTGWVALGREAGEKFGVSVVQPVYLDGDPTGAFLGFALGTFRIGDLLGEALRSQREEGIDLYLYDEAARAGERVGYRVRDSRPEAVAEPALAERESEVLSGLHWRSSLSLPERTWALLFFPSSSFLTSQKTWRAWEALAAVLTLTLLMGAYLFHALSRAAKIERLAMDLSRAKENLEEEMTMRRRSDAELRSAYGELQRAYETLERAQSSVIASEKLAALGRLTAGVSHEIANPLTSMAMSLRKLIRDKGIPEKAAGELRNLDEDVKRIAKISENLLSFARWRPPERLEIDVNEAVRRTVGLLEHELGSRAIEVEMRLAEGLPAALADKDQLQQVVLNLLTNARDAMPGGGRITLSTGRAPSGDGGFLEIRVSDSGVGMRAEDRERIFEPFFTTKPEGKGTGLGLAICQGIIEAHGGFIRVESEEGRGTTVIVGLPLNKVEG